MTTSQIRKDFAQMMNRPQQTTTLIDELKSCLILNTDWHPDETTVSIDEWFLGVIGSLFYKPNHYCLTFAGPQAIGKTHFFRQLLPNINWYSDVRAPYSEVPNVYDNIIIDMSEFESGLVKKTVHSDGFEITPDNFAEKRLASVCYTSNTLRPDIINNKRFIILHLRDIDRIRFNQIPTIYLWNEIWHKYITENRISESEIKQRFYS